MFVEEHQTRSTHDNGIPRMCNRWTASYSISILSSIGRVCWNSRSHTGLARLSNLNAFSPRYVVARPPASALRHFPRCIYTAPSQSTPKSAPGAKCPRSVNPHVSMFHPYIIPPSAVEKQPKLCSSATRPAGISSRAIPIALQNRSRPRVRPLVMECLG